MEMEVVVALIGLTGLAAGGAAIGLRARSFQPHKAFRGAFPIRRTAEDAFGEALVTVNDHGKVLRVQDNIEGFAPVRVPKGSEGYLLEISPPTRKRKYALAILAYQQGFFAVNVSHLE